MNSEAAAIASAESDAAAALTNTKVNLPFTFTKRAATTAVSSASVSLPAPPGTPIFSVAATATPTLPAGVPAYNLRLCQNDLIAMRQANQNVTVNQPAALSKY